MEMTYDHLDSGELTGETQADYLIALDACLQVVDGDTVVLEEPGFPVVELARSLLVWLEVSAPTSFEFSSMSYEEVGVLSIREHEGRWAFTSVWTPSVVSRSLDRTEVEEVCRRFISQVEQDLARLSIDQATLLTAEGHPDRSQDPRR